MKRQPLISLTSDFGLKDGYVGAMKAVILSIAPSAALVDITHEVRPQQILGGAFQLWATASVFGEHAIHLAVVDPGVGTARKRIAIATEWGTFVGPDNGIFALVLQQLGCVRGESGHLIDGYGVELTEQRYWRTAVSRTFHGRDVFAPVAAHLSLGVPIEEFGPRVAEIIRLPEHAPRIGDVEISATILHADRFGNLITNVKASNVSGSLRFTQGDITAIGPAASYQDAPLVIIEGSTGLLEIAARNSSAERLLDLHAGSGVQLLRDS